MAEAQGEGIGDLYDISPVDTVGTKDMGKIQWRMV